jgi:hypothetical protein
MVNIFNEITMQNYLFNIYTNYYDVLKSDLYYYLYNNLKDENTIIPIWELKNALTTNTNGKYI